MTDQAADTLGIAERLARVILLQQRATAAPTLGEIRLLAVNETALLVPYLTAVLLGPNGRCLAVSGLPTPNRDAPFTHLVERLGKQARRGQSARADRDDDLLAPERLWVPLGRAGHLLLARTEPWSEPERRLIQPWIDHLALVLQQRGRRLRPATSWRGRVISLTAIAALGAAMAIPIPMTVLAPAEVVPRDPDVVRAGIAGVVEELLVQPNQQVSTGEALVRLDARELTTRLDVVRQALEIAQAELRQAQASALQSREAQSALPILRSRIDQRRADVQLVESQLARVTIRAGRDGVVVLPDPTALRGRPVRQGERLLVIADPKVSELEMWIAASDLIEIAPAASVRLFLTVDPDRAIPAELASIALQAVPSPDGVIGFRAIAQFTGDPPRLGLRGMARIEGPTVRLGFYLFRRPFAALRQQVGL